MRADLRFAMPPDPGVGVTAKSAMDAWAPGGFGGPGYDDWRCIVTTVNRMPAVVEYLRTPDHPVPAVRHRCSAHRRREGRRAHRIPRHRQAMAGPAPDTVIQVPIGDESSALNTNATTRTPPPRRRCRRGVLCLKNIVTINDAVVLISSESVNTRNARKGPGRSHLSSAEGHGEHVRKDFDLASRAGHLARAHRLVSYRVNTTPPGNVRVCTRFRFTQPSSAVKNGVPPPPGPGRWPGRTRRSARPAWQPRRALRRRCPSGRRPRP